MTRKSSLSYRRAAFWAGARATIPLVVGAIPFGIIFGALAITSGLSPGGAVAMSAIVFAGSAQFVSISLIAVGTSLPIIVFTTFIVNLRHSLYAATLAPHLKSLPQRWLLPLGFWLTDESFLVAAKYFKEKDSSLQKRWYLLGSEVLMYANWQVVTWIGIRAGQAIPDPRSWGLDFAMIVTFIGMMIPEVRTPPHPGGCTGGRNHCFISKQLAEPKRPLIGGPTGYRRSSFAGSWAICR